MSALLGLGAGRTSSSSVPPDAPPAAARPADLRAEWAQLVGERMARSFEVQFTEGRRQEALVVRVAPIRESFDCPITGSFMEEPVMTCDGHVYDRAAIEQWLTYGRQTSPLTNLELEDLSFVPLEPLRKALEAFLNGRPELLRRREGELKHLEELRCTVGSLRQDLLKAQARSEARSLPSPALPSQRLQSAVQRALDLDQAGTEGKHQLWQELVACRLAAEQESADFEQVLKLALEILEEKGIAQRAGSATSGPCAGALPAVPLRSRQHVSTASGNGSARGVVARVPSRRRTIDVPKLSDLVACPQTKEEEGASRHRPSETAKALQPSGSQARHRQRPVAALPDACGNTGSSSSSYSPSSKLPTSAGSWPAAPAEDPVAAGVQHQRTGLIAQLFSVLLAGTDHDRLGPEQVWRFANTCGFRGTPAEWRAEYEAICIEYKSPPHLGLAYDQFLLFLQDVDGSAYCTNDELATLLNMLKGPPGGEVAARPSGLTRCIWSTSGWDRWPVCLPVHVTEQLRSAGAATESSLAVSALAASRRAVGGG